jgi:hypothetical protein
MMRSFCLTVIAAVVLATGACRRVTRFDPAEQALAAAASESLTVALSDSIAPQQGFVVAQSGQAIESVTACEDRLDSRGWESVGSRVLEMELPPGFTSTTQTNQVASWNGPAGSIHASSHSGDAHTSWSGLITSECDVFISGSPAHVDLVTMSYGRAVHVLIKVRDAPAISVDAQSRTLAGQAQLLHAIRTARVSSAWGR